MRHAARVAAASASRVGATRLGLKECSAGLATHAPAVVAPPKQSVRPAFTKDDPTHTDKWLQARGCAVASARARSCSTAWCVSRALTRLGLFVCVPCVRATQAPTRTPQEWIAGVAPLEVKASNIARCYGGAHSTKAHCAHDPTETRRMTRVLVSLRGTGAGTEPALGHPVRGGACCVPWAATRFRPFAAAPRTHTVAFPAF
jgi:hypothetical protein